MKAAKITLSVLAIVVGGLLALWFFGFVLVGLLFRGDPGPDEQSGPEELVFEFDAPAVEIQEPMLDFEALGPASFQKTLTAPDSSRYREVEIFLPPGDAGVGFAVQHDTPITVGAQGIAVRTKVEAVLLSSTELVTIPRPEGCVEGCTMLVWFTMGRDFQRQHQNPVVLIYAGDRADVTITDIEAPPPQMWTYN